MRNMVKVWDLPTRLFHWLLVALFAFLIISGESDDLMEYHFYAGYLLTGLVVFRVLWGFAGTRYARFSSFKLSPKEACSYTVGLLQAKHNPQYGHTPAGSLMVIIMLALLGLQVLTGMMSSDEIIWTGPLYNLVGEEGAEVAGEIHESIQGLLLMLVGIHVLAIILYKVKFKEPLVPAMIHGKKPELVNEAERESINWLKFLIAALPAAGLSYYLFMLPI